MEEEIVVQSENENLKELVDCFLRMVLGDQYKELINYSIDRAFKVACFDNEYKEYIEVTIETNEINRSTNQGPNKAVIYAIYSFDNVYLLSQNLNSTVSREYSVGKKRKSIIKRDVIKVKFRFCFKNGCFDSSNIHYDRSELAWNIYENIYEKLLIKHEINKDVGIVKYIENPIEVSGDCCFNFNIKKFKYFEDIIENGKIDDEIKLLLEKGGKTEQDYRKYVFQLLKICKMFHHSPLNIALMPRTGGLNNVKQNIANDRFDSFLWILSMGLSGQDAVIFGASNAGVNNKQLLRAFLNTLDRDVYNYCSLFYPVDKKNEEKFKEYIGKLINQGENAIMTPVEVHRYLYSAYKFWEYRKCHDCLLEDSIKLGNYAVVFNDSIFNTVIQT